MNTGASAMNTGGGRTLPLSAAAAEVLHPEIEYRLRYVIQEASKIARRGRRRVLLASDIEAAHAFLSGGQHGAPWRASGALPVMGLVETEALMQQQLLPALSTSAGDAAPSYYGAMLGGGGGGGGTSREARALLLAIERALQSDDFEALTVVLRTISRAADAPGLRRFVSTLVSMLVGEHDAALQEKSTKRQLTLLRIVAALSGNPSLPVEPSISALLSLVCGTLLHAAPWPGPPDASALARAAPRAPAASSSSSSSSSLLIPAEEEAGRRVALRVARKPYLQTAGGWMDGGAFEEQKRLRAAAAGVLRLIIERLRAAEAHTAAASVASHASQLFVRVLTEAPEAIAEGVDLGGEELEAGGAGASGGSSAVPPPRPSPSLFGALLGLQAAGEPCLREYLLPVALRLASRWEGDCSGPLGAGAAVTASQRAWSQACLGLLVRCLARVGTPSGGPLRLQSAGGKRRDRGVAVVELGDVGEPPCTAPGSLAYTSGSCLL